MTPYLTSREAVHSYWKNKRCDQLHHELRMWTLDSYDYHLIPWLLREGLPTSKTVYEASAAWAVHCVTSGESDDPVSHCRSKRLTLLEDSTQLASSG